MFKQSAGSCVFALCCAPPRPFLSQRSTDRSSTPRRTFCVSLRSFLSGVGIVPDGDRHAGDQRATLHTATICQGCVGRQPANQRHMSVLTDCRLTCPSSTQCRKPPATGPLDLCCSQPSYTVWKSQSRCLVEGPWLSASHFSRFAPWHPEHELNTWTFSWPTRSRTGDRAPFVAPLSMEDVEQP